MTVGVPNPVRRAARVVLPQSVADRLRSTVLRKYYVQSLVSREGGLHRAIRRSITRKRPTLFHLDVHVTDHCNLNCRGCEHYSSVSDPVFADLDATMKDLRRLAELFESIEQIYLLGGEPLLHSRVEEFVRETRRIFPATRLSLMTNGILVTRMPSSFWETMRDADATLLCDSYPINIPVDRINELGREHRVTVEWMKPAEEFFKIPIDVAASCDPAKSFERCRGLSNCPIVRDGRLYPCAHSAYADILVNRFGIEDVAPVEEDSISIWGDVTGDQAIDFLMRPTPWCSHCDFDSFETYSWSRGRGEAEEWVKSGVGGECTVNIVRVTPKWAKRLGRKLLPEQTVQRAHDSAQGKDYVPWMVSRENPLALKFRRNVLHHNPHLHRLVVHLTDHCNLNCRGCTHFSNIARPAFADPDQFEREFAQLESIFSGITEIYLLGGEPLLHPRVAEFMVSARRHFPASRINLMSNGVLVPRMDEEFWRAMHENDIWLVCDLYPIGLPVEQIEKLAKDHGVNLEWTDPRAEFFKLPLDLTGSQDETHAFQGCGGVNNCVLLRDGRLYPCAYIAYIDIFKERFGIEGMEPTEEDSISIFADHTPWEIFDFLCRPVPWCKHCDVDAVDNVSVGAIDALNRGVDRRGASRRFAALETQPFVDDRCQRGCIDICRCGARHFEPIGPTRNRPPRQLPAEFCRACAEKAGNAKDALRRVRKGIEGAVGVAE